MNKRHKWYKEICAWADGAEIEYKSKLSVTFGWYDDNDPDWNDENYEFRIKPQPKEDWVMICKKCGDELGIVYEPKEEIGDAEIKQMLNDIEYYQKRVEELEEQAQPLSDGVIMKIVWDLEHIQDKDIFVCEFARAIEQAHGIGEDK